MNLPNRAKDLAGRKYNRLTPIEPVGKAASGLILWRCDCDCGGKTTVSSADLRRGQTKSCGCARVEQASLGTHHRSKTATYNSWKAMRNRCTNPNSPDFKDYGGRGITVCDRWMRSFEAFLEDMGERPKGKSLDRERVNEGYGPGNCRWATPREQARNRRIKIGFTHEELLRIGGLAIARNLAVHRGDEASIAITDAELSSLGITVTKKDRVSTISEAA